MTLQSDPPEISKQLERADLKQLVARNIAQHRRALKVTQAQLADWLAVDIETISRFERGKHLPSLLTLRQLAICLQTTVAALMGETMPSHDPETRQLALWMTQLSAHDKQFVTKVVEQLVSHLAVDRAELAASLPVASSPIS
jgi:DNA-binding XRE family transcriptional regulator